MEKKDIEQIRQDLLDESMGAFFGGGIGAAIIEASDIETMSDEDVIATAKKQGIDISKYK